MEIICSCFGVSKDDIVEAIQGGMTSIADLAEETGASNGCGRCTQSFAKECSILLKENGYSGE